MNIFQKLLKANPVFYTRHGLYKSVFREQFVESYKHEDSGLSGGFSHVGYDIHLETVDVNRETLINKDNPELFILPPGGFALACTCEHFIMPPNYYATVHDKSTLARRALSVQNTIIEPGWKGYLTLELHNNNLTDGIALMPGQPIAQVILRRKEFFIDDVLNLGYDGKYQNQERTPVHAK